MAPRVLILSYHFYPSTKVGARRISELACRLRDAGCEVAVVAARDEWRGEPDPRLEGMAVTRIGMPPKIYPSLAARLRRGGRGTRGGGASGGGGGAGQSAAEPWLARLRRLYNSLEWTLDDHKLWSFLLLARSLTLGRRWEWIISSGPPMSVHVAARWLAAAAGARWAMDLRDPWVGNGIWPPQVRSRLRDGLENFFEKDCLIHADRVVAASPGIARALTHRHPWIGDRLAVVLNGFDGQPSAPAPPRSRLRLLYAGSLYFHRNPFPLLEALKWLVAEPGVDPSRVTFTLVGDCARWNGRDLAGWVRENGMERQLRLLPPVPHGEVRALMEGSEVLVNFAQGQPDQIPAKLYEYLASGRETLLIAEAESDAARITLESGAGRVVEPDDAEALRRTLRDFYTFYVERGLPFRTDPEIIGRFSRERQNRRYMELLALEGARH